MKNKKNTIYMYIILVIGIGVLNYPGISSLYNRFHEGKIIYEQEEALANSSVQALKSELESARAYNEKLKMEVGNGITDAFSEKAREYDDKYENLLNINGNGVMGYIEIPNINVYLPIAHGTSAEVLQRMAGHLKGTSLPVGGESTHSIISAHRGLPSAILFSDLDQLKEKDVFYIHMMGEVLAYEVNQIKTVLPEEVSEVQIEKGKDYITLLTCTPYGINSHRLLIRGVRIPYVIEERDSIQNLVQSIWSWLLQQKILLLSTVLTLISFIVIIVKSIRKRRKRR